MVTITLNTPKFNAKWESDGDGDWVNLAIIARVNCSKLIAAGTTLVNELTVMN